MSKNNNKSDAVVAGVWLRKAVALSIWTAMLAAGLIISIVAVSKTHFTVEQFCPIVTAIGFLGLATLILAIITTGAWVLRRA